MFIGNLVLVVGIVLIQFLLHVAVVSGVEAYWLSKVNVLSIVLTIFRTALPTPRSYTF